MKWYHRIESIRTYRGENIDQIMEQQQYAGKEEVGLIHETNGAGIMVRDNAVIQCFSENGIGFEVDPKRGSISFYAPKIKLFCEEFKVLGSKDSMDTKSEEWLAIQKMSEEG